MTREKLYLMLIVLLVLINVSALYFFMQSRENGVHPGPRLDKKIEEQLSLNEEQMGQFEQMKRTHHEQMMDLDEQMKEPFNEYFAILETGDTTRKKEIEQKISALYQSKMNITYKHFDELKAICNTEQKEKFKALIPHLLEVMQPNRDNHRGMPPPPPDERRPF